LKIAESFVLGGIWLSTLLRTVFTKALSKLCNVLLNMHWKIRKQY